MAAKEADVEPALVGARVGVTGQRRGAELANILERRGASVVFGPTLSGDRPAPDDEIVADTLAILDVEPRWLVATTGVGMRVWQDVATRSGLQDDVRGMAERAHCVARGAKAVGGLAGFGATALWVSPNNTDADVVSWLRHRLVAGDAVVVQVHGGRSTTYEELAHLGVDLMTVMPYRWELPSDPSAAQQVVRAAVAGELDVITFTSAGAVTNLFLVAEQMGDDVVTALRLALSGPVAVASVGPVTAEAVEVEGGINRIVPRRWRTADLVRGIESWWARRDDPEPELCLRMVPSRSSVNAGGHEIELGPREYAVLAALARRPGVLVPAIELSAEAWGHEAAVDGGQVKHQIARLRQKLGGVDVHIETVRGRGYRVRSGT